MRAKDLPNVDGMFGKSDPFVIIKRGPHPSDAAAAAAGGAEGGAESGGGASDSDFVKIHQTEWVKDQLDPMWQPFEITVNRMCNGQTGSGPLRPLLIEVWDYEKGGGHQFMGEARTSLSELVQLSAAAEAQRIPFSLPLQPRPDVLGESEKDRKKRAKKVKGAVWFDAFTVDPHDAAEVECEDDVEYDLSFECANLPNMDTFSKTDAVVSVYLQDVRPSSAAAKAKEKERNFLGSLKMAAGKHDTQLKTILHETALSGNNRRR